MNYERKFTPDEVKVLGDDPLLRVDRIINENLKRLFNASAPLTVETRVLALMSKTNPMTPLEIMDTHDAVHGPESIALNYVRAVLNGLMKSNMVKRHGRGHYIKVKS